MTAKSVFIDNQTALPTAGDSAFQETVKWGRIAVVGDRKLADIVFLLTRRPEGGTGRFEGGVVYFQLTVTDPATGNALWSDSKLERIRVLGVNPVKQDVDELWKRIEEQEKRAPVTSPHRSATEGSGCSKTDTVIS